MSAIGLQPLLLLVFIALMYFLMIAPNQKKQKKWQEMLSQLKNGDRVTTNGGISLRDMGGDVQATTTNGGLSISLAGDSWQGAGLVAKSTNGGVRMTVPTNYSAHLIAGTVNGGTDIRLPMTASVIDSRRHIDGQIGHGGPTVQVETINGGVSIN